MKYSDKNTDSFEAIKAELENMKTRLTNLNNYLISVYNKKDEYEREFNTSAKEIDGEKR